MQRASRAVAITISAALAVASVGATVPAAPAADLAVSQDALDRMSGALVTAQDIPGQLGRWRSAEPSNGEGNADDPDVCPTSRKQELGNSQAWATVTHSGTTERGAQRPVAITSNIWLYDSDSVVRRSPDSALRSAIKCKNRSRKIDGKFLTHRSSRTSATSATQTLTVVSKNTRPRKTRIVTSWEVSGRHLISVSLQRYGKAANAKIRPVEARAVERMAGNSAGLLDDPRPLESEDIEPPVYPDAPSAQLKGPAESPWVVSVGDSYISGEGGAWKGNVENSLADGSVYRGAQTYYDNADRTAELIKNCHRSDSASIHIGVAQSRNLACSGATTTSHTDKNGDWKPGIDFGKQQGGPGVGQAQMLQDFAKDHDVRMVALSIGGNDFEFADIVESCVKDFLFSPYLWSSYCSEDKKITGKVNETRVNEVAGRIAGAITNIQTAMSNAGYTPDQWRLVVQNYPSPIPRGDGFRYWQTILRQSDGGCGFWNRDANWANDYTLPQVNKAVAQAIGRSKATNVLALDLSAAFNDNRLCENGTVSVDTLAGASLAPWTTEKEFRYREWVMQIRAVSDSYSDAQKQESFHPNYYGQLAERNCMRQVYQQQRGGKCVRENRGINSYAEPNMALR